MFCLRPVSKRCFQDLRCEKDINWIDIDVLKTSFGRHVPAVVLLLLCKNDLFQANVCVFRIAFYQQPNE